MKAPDLEKLRKLILDEETATKFYGRFTVEPFERGYGHTIGNSLRRILLSGLEGAAITSVKISGALHEFAVLKGVKEDIAHIILNLKKIRVKLHSSIKSEVLYLKVRKSGKVIAKDIELKTGVEIMNPEQEIANVDAKTLLEMELKVSLGKGYVLAEEVKSGDDYSVGTIAIDSLFSPVVKVNYDVENTRVEQNLNYDRLVMEIWTDGTISPGNALAKSANILKKSLVIFTDNDRTIGSNDIIEEEFSESKGEEIFNQSISVINLSTRTLNGLKNAGIATIRDIIKLNEENILNFDNLGKRSLEEIKDGLERLNLSLEVMDITREQRDDKNL
ncbi:MAG: DNA-directed RNA polymerase subunit alpha [Endomicrobium sp.]|jgi:DNA-directed RNA polymerase subunit alpha|nr:DNA-directed RNA polymerase subunit alpha [Endomicrobium sp.]